MMMERINPDVAERIRQRKPLCLLIGHDELTSDLPQFQSDKTGKDLISTIGATEASLHGDKADRW